MNTNIYLVFLHSLWISQKKLSLIFSNNNNFKDFYLNISAKNLKNYYKENEIEKILGKKEKLDENYIINIIKNQNIQIISIKDKDYPKLLKEIQNPPFLLYIKWKVDNSPKIAIIWSRNMTLYWKKVIEKITPDLSKYFVIVSWWANWCDSEAHMQAIKNQAKTISIIWTWIDIDYPVSNKKLYQKIIENNWWILSIFPIWENANSYNFPIRNEIIAWISSWVLVIESSEKSWTLITVNLALEQGKDVFAVVWDIFKANSLWCNNLIKNGHAKMVTNSEDILEEYNIVNKINSEKIQFSNDKEKIIYDLLILENLDIDELIEKTKFSLNDISVNISMLEIKWVIKKSMNWRYEIN